MIRLGVTGGIGSGKSLAVSFMRESGIPTADADIIAKDLIRNHEPLKSRIGFQFGEDIYAGGNFNSPLLAERAFSCRVNQNTLNSLVHPAVNSAVRDFFTAQDQAGAELAAVEASMLLEAGSLDAYDHILLITAEPELRLARSLTRGGLSAEQIRSRMELQMPESEKRKLCHTVIENNGTESELRQKVLAFCDDLMKNPDPA